MIEAVFISDLHLHPNDLDITQRFDKFIEWAKSHTKRVYILGDLFHVWPGDDALDVWSKEIAAKLQQLAKHGISTYFMYGNRDFLVGERFAKLANMELLLEPTIITLGGESILLVHGDRYCIHDKGHIWLRRLTRNSIFPKLFLKIPYILRSKLVQSVRTRSQSNRSKPMEHLEIVPSSMLHHMQQMKCYTLIHGHIHKPGLRIHNYEGFEYRQYVLSDWDDTPLLMCYDSVNSFYFDPI